MVVHLRSNPLTTPVLPLTGPADVPSVGSNSQVWDASGANPELRRQLFQLSSGRIVGYPEITAPQVMLERHFRLGNP